MQHYEAPIIVWATERDYIHVVLDDGVMRCMRALDGTV